MKLIVLKLVLFICISAAFSQSLEELINELDNENGPSEESCNMEQVYKVLIGREKRACYRRFSRKCCNKAADLLDNYAQYVIDFHQHLSRLYYKCKLKSPTTTAKSCVDEVNQFAGFDICDRRRPRMRLICRELRREMRRRCRKGSKSRRCRGMGSDAPVNPLASQ